MSTKEFLEKLYETEMLKNKEERVFIGFKDLNSDKLVHFELEFTPNYIDTVKNITKDFHLTTKISLNNMNLFSIDGSIKRYNSAHEIMNEYYTTRLELYGKRKAYQLDTIQNVINLISNKIKFILMVVENKILINRRNKKDIIGDLEKFNFPKINTGDNISYDYLLSMPIYQLTSEKIEKLNTEMNEKQVEYDTLNNRTPIDIWKTELNELKAMS